jgi:DNA-binding beta-propeller fold protein YncE
LTRRLLFIAFAFAALAPVARADAASTALTQLPVLNACISETGADLARGGQQECVQGSGLSEPDAIAMSPDGRNVYTAGFDGTLSMMSRDPATGALAPLGCFSTSGSDAGGRTCTPARELADADAVVVSPDGQNVYVGGEGGDGGIAVFDRDPATGLLTQPPDTSGCVAESGSVSNCVLAKEVGEPLVLAISPDGKSLYSGDDRGGITVLRRAADGSLSQSADPRTGCISEDGNDSENSSIPMACVDGKALGRPEGLAVSPNGQQVYASDNDSAGVAVLQRDATTGELSQSAGMTGCVTEGGKNGQIQNVCTPGHGLHGPGTLLVTPDGAQLYMTTFSSSGVALFDRNSSTGDLTQKPGTAGCITEDGGEGFEGPANTCGVGRNLEQAFGIAMSPDGTRLYVGSFVGGGVLASAARTRGIIGSFPHASGGVTVFDRDPATGLLQQPAGSAACVNEVGGTFTPSLTDGCAAGIALQGLDGLAISPDGTNVYAADGDSQAVTELGPPLPAPAAPPRDTTAPKVSSFSITHRVFAVARAATPVSARVRGTAFRFALSEQAAVKITIKRALPGRRVGKHCVKPNARGGHRHACTRFVPAGTLRRASERSGRDSVKFSGRIGRRALTPGRYRAAITATDPSGNASKPRSVSFRIVR